MEKSPVTAEDCTKQNKHCAQDLTRVHQTFRSLTDIFKSNVSHLLLTGRQNWMRSGSFWPVCQCADWLILNRTLEIKLMGVPQGVGIATIWDGPRGGGDQGGDQGSDYRTASTTTSPRNCFASWLCLVDCGAKCVEDILNLRQTNKKRNTLKKKKANFYGI